MNSCQNRKLSEMTGSIGLRTSEHTCRRLAEGHPVSGLVGPHFADLGQGAVLFIFWREPLAKDTYLHFQLALNSSLKPNLNLSPTWSQLPNVLAIELTEASDHNCSDSWTDVLKVKLDLALLL